MKRKWFLNMATVLVALSVMLMASTAMAVSWTNWTSTTPGDSGAGTGTIVTASGSIGVTLSGSLNSFVDGDYYFNNSSTSYTNPSGTFGGLAPSDLIQEVNSGSVMLTFSKPVEDLYFALVSVGQPSGYYVSYAFQNPFAVVSYGPNYWGYGGYTITGNTFNGSEFNGVLKFTGIYNSLTFSISPNEFWHGFNIGVASASVPEPTTMLLLGLGLVGLAGLRRKL